MASHPARDFWSVINETTPPVPAAPPATAPQATLQPVTPVNCTAVATNDQLGLTESDWFGATPRILENYFWNTNGIANSATAPFAHLPFSSQDDPFLDPFPSFSTPFFQSPSPSETWDSQTEQSPFSTLAPETPTYQSKPQSKLFWDQASVFTHQQFDPFAFVLSSVTSAKSTPDDSFPEFEDSSSPPSGLSGLGLDNSSANHPLHQSSPPPSSDRESRSQTPYSEPRSTRTRKAKSNPHTSLQSASKRSRGRLRREETHSSQNSSVSNRSSSTHTNDYSPLPPLVVKLPVAKEYLESLNSTGHLIALVVTLPVAEAYLQDLKITGRLVPLPIHFVEARRVIPEPEAYTYPRTIKPPWRSPWYGEFSEENMAPSYRASNRRQNRAGYNDHDVFDGLPVRHWRRELTTVIPPPDQESTKPQNDIWAVELPHGMPKDSHLLTQHSQDLLRAARSGKIYKRPAPTEEEEIDPEIAEKQEKKEDDGKDKTFSAPAWKQIPRNQEGPDIQYLAKRRKGLTTYTKPLPVVPTVIKATVRRTDAAGNEYNQDVIVPDGQQVDGEIISQVVIPDPSAVQQSAPSAQPTPTKRKTPVVKKKPKAVRGRKKKVVGAPTSVPPLVPASAIPGGLVSGAEVVGPALVKIETEAIATPATTEDTVMGEGSVAASDDEEGDEDGDEGDDDDESIGDQNSPAKIARTASPSPMSLPTMKAMPDIAPPNFGPPSGLAFAPHLEWEKSEGKSGSPLKNVALSTSAVATPLTSPIVTGPSQPFPEIVPAQILPPQAQNAPEAHGREELAVVDDAMDIDTVEIASTIIPPPPPNPKTPELQIVEEVRKEEEEEEEMLLDIVENANNASIGQAEPLPIAVPEVAAQIDILLEEPRPAVSISEQPTPQDPTAEPEPLDQVSQPEKIARPVEEVPAPVEVPIQPTELPKTPNVVPAEVLPEPEVSSEQQNPEVISEKEAVHEEGDLPDTQVLPQADILPDPKDDIKDEVDDDSDGFPDLLGGLEKSLGQPPPRPAPAKVEEPVEVAQEVGKQSIVHDKDEKSNEEVDPSAGSS